MGRVKIQLKKIENNNYRHITFAKRKRGLLKKAYELSTLCDVEVALILFSPAGKLFLFDGKKRVEETVARYLDVPARRRGCINKLDIDSHLREIQKEILICSTKLENVEKQLQYFLRNPSCVKSMSEIKYHEMILEETLKLVQFRKARDMHLHDHIQYFLLSRRSVLSLLKIFTCGLLLILQKFLEENSSVQPASQEFGDAMRPRSLDCSENPLRAQNVNSQGYISRSLNYNIISWQSHEDVHASRTFTDHHTNEIQLSRNILPQPLVETFSSSMTYVQERRYLAGNEVNGGHPASGIVNANFPPRMDIKQQARATRSEARSEAGSSMRTFCGNSSNLDSNVWFSR
ncbi:hypothetical protein DITRI_Ditri18aG0084500 [Diplodiscus trichospermus]